jgi:hypothetical protein
VGSREDGGRLGLAADVGGQRRLAENTREAVTATVPVSAPAADVVDAFAARLLDMGRAHVDLAGLIAAWDAADPGWAGSAAGRLRLADALDRLDATGTIELPSRRGTRWDTTLPRLPTRIVIPANRRVPAQPIDAASEPWVPALAWAGAWIRKSRPPERLRKPLVVINRWLASTIGRSLPIVCREERSLEIFEDEKMLGSLTGTVLFGEGRLSLAMLACEAPIGGVRIAKLADVGPVLVVENKATFDSAWRGLRGSNAPPGYAAVVFGGGDQAASLVPELSILESLVGIAPTLFEYAGDVDIAGVSAAAAFIDAARMAGLSARPATALWEAVGAAKPAGEDLSGDERERAVALAAIGRLGLPSIVAERLDTGVRVPQERIDRTRFAETSWWPPR